MKNKYKNYIDLNLDKSGWISKEKILKNRNIDVYNDIIDFSIEYKLYCSFKEKVWYYYNNVKILKKCNMCDNLPIFYNFKKGYGSYCCLKCRRKDETNIWNNVKEKTKEKYGFENPSKVNKLIEKRKKTNLERYNGTSPANSVDILDKIKKTNLIKLGVEYPSQNKNVKEKYYSTIKTKNLKNNSNLIKIDYDEYKLLMNCDNGLDHKFQISYENYQNRKRYNISLCTKCFPINSYSTSIKENELLQFIRDNYNEEIITSSRNIISPYELDIYLPKLNVAFEFNGLWWHNELYKEKNYHLNKTELCEKHDIQLIHIYEDDWDYNKDIVKSLVLNKLNKTFRNINSINYEIREIYNKEMVKDFINKNHIENYIDYKNCLGLYYNFNLVSLMLFDDNKILRFCNKINTNIVNSFNKLFNYYINNNDFKEIKISLNRSYFNNDILEKIKYYLISKTEPTCFYIYNKRKNLKTFNKKNHRIYDSGNLEYILKMQ